MKDKMKLSGKLRLVLKGKDGKVKEDRTVKNLIVNDGLDFITARMIGTGQNVMSHMAVGTDNTAAAASQTDLAAILGSKVALDSYARSGSNNETIDYVCTFGAGVSTGAIVEAGIFNNASAATGDMLARTVFATINKGASDSLILTWSVTLAAS